MEGEDKVVRITTPLGVVTTWVDETVTYAFPSGEEEAARVGWMALYSGSKWRLRRVSTSDGYAGGVLVERVAGGDGRAGREYVRSARAEGAAVGPATPTQTIKQLSEFLVAVLWRAMISLDDLLESMDVSEGETVQLNPYMVFDGADWFTGSCSDGKVNMLSVP